MFKFAGGLVGVLFSPVPRFAPAQPDQFVDALSVASQLLERVGIFEVALVTASLFLTCHVLPNIHDGGSILPSLDQTRTA